MSAPVSSAALPELIAEQLRDQIIDGRLLVAERLSEARMVKEFNVSRNTLREAFRILTRDGLLRYELNRGVFVAEPSMATIYDIFHIRRLIEVPALENSHPSHPGVARMHDALCAGETAAQSGDWQTVGSANMSFHAAIVSLADSARLRDFFQRLCAELRLAFGLINSPQQLHQPYLAENRQIYDLAANGQSALAAKLLESYLKKSERNILQTFANLAP